MAIIQSQRKQGCSDQNPTGDYHRFICTLPCKPQAGTPVVSNSLAAAPPINWERAVTSHPIFGVLGILNPSCLQFLLFFKKPPPWDKLSYAYPPLFLSAQHSAPRPRLPLTRCNSHRGRQRGVHFDRVRDLQDGDAAIRQADGHHGGASRVPLQVIDHRCASRVLGQFVISKGTFLLFRLLQKTNIWDSQTEHENKFSQSHSPKQFWSPNKLTTDGNKLGNSF